LQNSHHRPAGQFLRGVWLIIAGVLLLGPTAALAGSYIKVWEKGVVYYYYSNRGQPQPRQAGGDTLAPRRVPFTSPGRSAPGEAQVVSRETNQPQDIRPRLINAVMRMESERARTGISVKGTPDLGQLRLGKAREAQVVNSPDPTENVWMGPRYLGRLWSLWGYGSPLVSAPPHQGLPPIQETQAQVREVCSHFLHDAQEPYLKWGYGKPGAESFIGSNNCSYCFPVAAAYSFKDSWGDSRSGGRVHHATDIFAWEGTPVYAITAGVIHQLAVWNEAGISLLLAGQDGRGYGYMHLQRYAEGIVEGKSVKSGELIAYVGHTGVRWDAPHLHIQVYADHRFARDELMNPYGLLVQLSNGRGVTEPLYQQMAQRRIPAAEVINSGIVRLSGSATRRYRGSARKVEDTAFIYP
jgi:murein DD-endopeptidase MepM/ murein hydrolase activator NlpD